MFLFFLFTDDINEILSKVSKRGLSILAGPDLVEIAAEFHFKSYIKIKQRSEIISISVASEMNF